MSIELYRTIIAISVVLVSASIIHLTIIAATTLKKTKQAVELLNDTANEINFIKNGLKSGLLTLAGKIIDNLQKGGENSNE